MRRLNILLVVLLVASLTLVCGCETAPGTGTINVTSSPPGAEVYLDNAYTGTTPVIIPNVTPGAYTIELRLNGFETWTVSGTLDEGGTADVQASLTPSPAPVAVAKGDILGSGSYIDSSEVLHTVGEVENTGSVNLQYIEIIATFYDASNTVVDTKFSYAYVNILEPGQKSPFDVMESSKVTSIGSTRLQVAYQETADEPYHGLRTISSSSYIDSMGVYHVAGEVQNNGSVDEGSVEIIGTFYDAYGQVVGAGFTYAEPSAVPAGLTVPFDLTFNSPQVSRIRSYVLYLQGS